MLQKAWEHTSEKVLTGLWACIKHQIREQGWMNSELFVFVEHEAIFLICLYIHIHILPLASELSFKQQQIKSGCMTSLPLLLLNVDSCITAGSGKHSRAHMAAGIWAEGLLIAWGPVSLPGAASNFFFQSSSASRWKRGSVCNMICARGQIIKA